MGEFGVLIPALNPDEKLVRLVDELIMEPILKHNIIIVDDGSLPEYQRFFNEILAQYPDEVVVLRHESNQGKGAALKHGLSYFSEWCPNIEGVVTMDADGQHAVTDVLKLTRAFNGKDLVIGSRQFSQDIPFRSRFGNVLTNKLTHFFTGLDISNTQTGLRIVPSIYVPMLQTFPENHFEFEFKMLLNAKANDIQIREVPIQTIYIDENASSHFRVVADSLSIYAQFMKFIFSGLVSFLLDITLFAVFLKLMGTENLSSVMWATVGARLISGAVNYGLNRQVVFDKQGDKTLIKYCILMAVQMLCSGALTYLIAHTISQSGNVGLATGAKLIGDGLLCLLSFQIQKHIVFKRRSA
ncbi:glycosyltransferase [Weissella viridescens]|uniref:Glycosyltransferase n=1 Tax=Weissella viridescens TaxID=1629 RepID=A0A3P2RGS1_WEIVI|nr:bifunctional glycosyltransferase family 2/GtrA family protein [Weissella viridescens]RRG18765.1 glycosyltransferase [Weissella viridescens]